MKAQARQEQAAQGTCFRVGLMTVHNGENLGSLQVISKPSASHQGANQINKYINKQYMYNTKILNNIRRKYE